MCAYPFTVSVLLICMDAGKHEKKQVHTGYFPIYPGFVWFSEDWWVFIFTFIGSIDSTR